MLLLKTDLDTYTAHDLQNDLALLPSWRREKALRYRHFRQQAECAISFRLLQKALSRAGIDNVHDIQFIHNPHGKPALKDHPDLHFSISHCHHAIACILDSVPVGIDVEDTGRYNPSLARYCMNDTELAQIQDNDTVFTLLWTQKEAVFKLLGTGICDNIKEILQAYNIKDIEIESTPYTEQGFVLSVARHRHK